MRSFEKINNLKNIDTVTWQEAYKEHISFFQDQQDYPTFNQNFEQLLLGRTFYPRPFVSSPIQHVISLPWATEYFILPYWFFFFSLGLVSVWLIILYIQTTIHIESRFLRRETRGFSRAQTGDALTSVVPLAWSISMLMHASVHSFNFDDNTAGTVFSFNVLAYQWGWNYYFPSDLIKLFKDGPKRVGHSSIENFSNNEPYSSLLSRFRTEYIKKVTMQGSFVNKNFPLLSPLNFYSNSSDSNVSFEPVIFFPFNTSTGTGSLQNYTSDFLLKTESTNSQYYNTYSWFLSSPAAKSLSNYFTIVTDSFLEDTNLLVGYNNFFLLPQLDFNFTKLTSLCQNTFLDMYPYSNNQLSPFRSSASLALLGNKYFSIHKHFSNNCNLSYFFKSNPSITLSNYIVSIGKTPNLFNLNYLPFGFFNTQPTKPLISSTNIMTIGFKHNYTGFGLLSKEDFNFTSSAAASVSDSLSINSVLLNFLPIANDVKNFSKFSIINSNKSTFSVDFINDWSCSFLLSIFSQSWILSATNLLNSPKFTLLNNDLNFLYQSIFNHFTIYFFNFFSTNNLNWSLSWLDFLFTKNYIRGVNYNELSQNKFDSSFVVNSNNICFFLWNSLCLNLSFIGNLPVHTNKQLDHLNNKLVSFFNVSNVLFSCPHDLDSFNFFSVYSPFSSVYFIFKKNLVNPQNLNSTFSCLDQINLASFNKYGNWFFNSIQKQIPLNLNILSFNNERSFSTKLLNNLDFSKPVKNFSSFIDPIDFSNGSVNLYFSPLINFVELFNWSITWINLVVMSNTPSYKVWKGGFVRRSFSNELFSYYSLFSHKQTYLKNAQLSKINLLSELPKVTLYDVNFGFLEEAPALLDKEWAPYNFYTLLDVPAPFEDLDPIFIHKRWTTDINTTRRTDHSTRYLVGSGPVLSSQKNRKLNYFSNSWSSFIGPQGYKTITPKDALCLSNSSLFYNYPSNKFANTQFLLGSYFLNSSLNFKDNAFSSILKGYPMLPFYKVSFNSNLIINNLFLNQSLFSFYFSFNKSFDLSLNTFNSIWSFRPSVFSQNRVRNFGQNSLCNSTTSSLILYLLTYNKKINNFSSFDNINADRLNNHTFIHILTENQNNIQIFNKFFLQLSSNFIELGGLKKDLYTFIPEDIRSIKRLRTSKAVCLPSDIPMHIVCGSKDVIHSWAIPGLGIKIDCIPGFSSHRRLTIRWRGTFWGQCMEVCGRYHHWMPILIHVTHRDLFLSWCLSFLKALETRQTISTLPVVLPSQILSWLVLQEQQIFRE